MVLRVGENSKAIHTVWSTAEVANWSPNVFYLCRIALVIITVISAVTQLASSLLYIPLAIEHHGSPE